LQALFVVVLQLCIGKKCKKQKREKDGFHNVKLRKLNVKLKLRGCCTG
jgi:hypothetical protein